MDGLEEAFGGRLQTAAGMFGLDHPRVGRRVAGPGADLDEGVQVRGGQSAHLLSSRGEHAVEPLGVLCVLGRVGQWQGGDRGVQGGVRGGGERVGGDAGHVVQAVRIKKERAEEGLLDVEHRLGRWDGVEVVFVGFGGVGH